MVYDSIQDVQEGVRICKEYIAKHLSKGYRLAQKEENPFSTVYSPEMDMFLALRPTEASYYQSLIGVMRRMVEIWNIDINTKMSLLPLYLATPSHELWKEHIISCS